MRFLNKTVLILFICCFSTAGYAINLSGHINNHHGNELSIYYINNFMTESKTYVNTCQIDTSGFFRFSFEAETIRTYYIDLGKNKGQITLVPKQNIQIDFPNFDPLSKAERLNPYYEKQNILLYNEDVKDINYYLTEIEIHQALWLDKIIKSNTPEYTAQEILDSTEIYRKKLNNAYLKEYLDMKSSFFYKMNNPGNQSIIKDKLLRHQAPQLNNPAYTQLFTQQFNDPFLTKEGLFYDYVSKAILSGQLDKDFITTTAKNHHITVPETAALLCIKGFYDASVIAPQYEAQLLPLLSMLEEQIEDSTLKELCHSTREKMDILCLDQAAPYYELYTPKGKKVPTILKRKFVLLAFVNTNIFDCQKQLRLLEKYKANYKREMEVVIIATYQEKEELEHFLSRNDYKNLYFTLWNHNEQLLNDYYIKSLPTYYLIAPNGNLLYAPLSSPETNMENELQEAILH